MKLAITTFLFVIEFTASAQATPCHSRTLLQNLTPSLPVSGSYVKYEDGFGFRHPLILTETPPSSPLRKRSSAQMNQLFEQVRELLITEVTRGFHQSSWTSDQQIMVSRLRDLSLELKSCTPTQAIASNSSLRSTISICEEALTQPALPVIMLLGHELGHSIDFHNLTLKRLRAKRSSLPLRNQIRPQLIEQLNVESRGAGTHLLHDLDLISNSPTNKFINRFIGRQQEVIQELLRNGHLEVVDHGIPMTRQPTRNVLKCLAENYRGYEFPQNTRELENHPMGVSEATAQVWGARALARYIEQGHFSTPADVISIVANSYLQVTKLGREDSKTMQLNEIYLSEEVVQRALRCEPAPEQSCMRELTF